MLLLAVATSFAADNWKGKLQLELPLLGRRNWIVVADSAYSLQILPGVESIHAGADQHTQKLLHEQISGNLDEAGKTFNILIIKTHLPIPFASVFFQLRCG